MKIFITTLALFICVVSYAQEIDVEVEEDNMEEQDVSMKNVAVGSVYPEDIADAITEDLSGAKAKAVAIFEWVSQNIEYDVKMYEDFKTGERDKSKGKRIKRSDMEEHNAKKVTRTLKKRAGICEDYALVFKAIADEANLEVDVVKGWIRNDPTKLRSVGVKHVWNVVKIDGEWLHLDATYASGFVDKYNDFEFDYEPTGYLFPDKEQMQYTHFPKKSPHILGDSLLTKDLFKSKPIVGKGFFTHKITALSPNETNISVKKGENFTIAFESDSELKNLTATLSKKEETYTAKHVQSGNRHNVILTTKDFSSGPIEIKADGELLMVYRMTVVK